MMLQKQNQWKWSVCCPQSILWSSWIVVKNFYNKGSLYKPDVTIDYNKTVGGVDLLSRVLIPYSTQQWGIKWYRKIGELMLDISVYNSFIVYQYLNPENRIKDHLRYWIELIKEILTNHHLGLHHTKLVQPHQTCCVLLRDILFLKSPLHLVNPMHKDVFTAQNLGQGEILVFGGEDVGSVCAY